MPSRQPASEPAQWTADVGRDEWDELVSTVADEVVPTTVSAGEDFRRDVAAEVVLFIIEDSEMRRNMVHLLRLTDSAGDFDNEIADRWTEAVAAVRARYPEDVFTPDSEALDGKAGTFARLLCDEITRIATEAEHG